MNGDIESGIARADLCRFLAACYYQPAPEFAEERLFESMCRSAARIGAEVAASATRLGESFEREGVNTLLLDYARLFIGPNQVVALPYGSVWLAADKTLMGETTIAVLRLYEESGFEIAENFRELPDHIAAELEFLYLLKFRENQARRAGDASALAAACGLRQRFLDEHLGRWVGPFTAAVRAGSQSEFYRELAALTEQFVRIETRTGGGTA